MKYRANYEKTERGKVKKGETVVENDILFVKSAKIHNATDERYDRVDRSVRYKFKEEAIVEQVIETRNNEDTELSKVKLRMIRPLMVGDKVSSTNGNKSVIGILLNEADMPYAEDGLVPDLILNAHAIPTRMVIGQIIATVIGEYCVRKGVYYDAKPFKKIDIDAILEELKKYGVHNGSHKRLYNGMTGNWLDTFIYIGPVAYQRQKRFVLDQAYAIRDGPTSNLTRQPTEGKANEGGLRLGEMEVWVLLANKLSRTLFEKFYDDSDGMKLPICRKCGKRAIVNENSDSMVMYKCKMCGDSADIAVVNSSWVSNIFMHQTASMGVPLKIGLQPLSFVRKYDEKTDKSFID